MIDDPKIRLVNLIPAYGFLKYMNNHTPNNQTIVRVCGLAAYNMIALTAMCISPLIIFKDQLGLENLIK